MTTAVLPPLALYIHIPWCVRKCPYCDFNSHAQQGELPEADYVAAMLEDLDQDIGYVSDRAIQSVFIGGGTPSLFSADAYRQLFGGLRQRLRFAEDVEITLEANPGTLEQGRFAAYRELGINRLSIGVQSFDPLQLQQLGRIHSGDDARRAIASAQEAGFDNFNVDLMHGLSGQHRIDALRDLDAAIESGASHISWYQLTIEPNTPFYSRPPELPDDDILWDIQAEGHKLLAASGYEQYEISGYSKPGNQCRHNLNYWRFGDYIGIGCGAHGKLTNIENRSIIRTVKVKHPRGYMTLNRPYLDHQNQVEENDLAFEFFMNRFRLVEPCPQADFAALTGTSLTTPQQDALGQAISNGLLAETAHDWQVTSMGRRYLNTLLSAFV